MKKYFSSALLLSATVIFTLLNANVRAQSGTSCSSAINISLSTSSSTCLSASIASNQSTAWYKFTAIRSVTNFGITVDASQLNSLSGAHVFTGQCNNLIELGATVDVQEGAIKIFTNFLSIGQTYYIQVNKSTTASTSSFTICSSPATQLPWQVNGDNTEFSGSISVAGTTTLTGAVTLKDGIGGIGYAGNGKRVIIADPSGNFRPLAPGTTSQVLFGDATWGDLPPSSNLWQANGNNIYFNNGKVGINTNNPQHALDVVGDLNVSNDVFVGGAVLIGHRINATIDVTTPILHADTISLDSTSLITGQANFVGEANFQAAARFRNQLSVEGSADITGTVTVGSLSTLNSFETPTLTLGPPTQLGGFAAAPIGGGGNLRATITTEPGAGEQSPANIIMSNNTKIRGSLDVGTALTLANGQVAIGTETVSAGDAGAVSRLRLPSNTMASGNFNIGQNLTFGNGLSGLGFVPSSGTSGGGTIFTGKQGPPNQVTSLACTIFPNVNSTFAHNGMYQSYHFSNNNIGVLSMGYDGANGSIDVAGINQNGFPGLLLNYYCGNDVAICTNPANGGGSNQKGGVVGIGENLEIGFPTRDLTATLNLRTSLAKAVKVADTWQNEIFSVSNDGATMINSGNASPLVIKNPGVQSIDKKILEVGSQGSLTLTSYASQSTSNVIDVFDVNSNKVNFRVKANGNVYAREVIVSAASNAFPDYVFASDYKLMPLTDVKVFTEQNKHLPNMPTAKEVQKDGINLGEIQRVSVEKIEEIYLYMFDLSEELKASKEEIKALKEKVKQLESK